ncbi:MAG: hypothetical protein Q7T14_13870 [Aestuariivirga sp.]|nr:hypothetical protein [Aestuariivirga sp.]
MWKLSFACSDKRRSFDEVACRSVLNTAVQQLPTKAIIDRLPDGMQQEDEWSNAKVCSVALLSDRLNWSVDKSSQGVVLEAQKRGLGVNDCRATLGLTRLPDVAKIPSIASYDNKMICLMALDLAIKSQTSWQSLPIGAAHIAEPSRR